MQIHAAYITCVIAICISSCFSICNVEKVNLAKTKLLTSAGTENASFAFDGDLATSVTNSKWMIFELRDSESEFVCVKDVLVTPARPSAKLGPTAEADKKNTKKCIFPFKKGNVEQYRCVDSGFGFFQCSYGEHLELSDWSSCKSTQPDGTSSDDIEIMLSSKTMKWDDFYKNKCGNTGSGMYNSIRTVNCASTMINAKYIALKINAFMQIAELTINAVRSKHLLTVSNKVCKEGKSKVTLKTSEECLNLSNIDEIAWYSETSEIGRSSPSESEFQLAPARSGSYYFEFRNKNNDAVFKSNVLMLDCEKGAVSMTTVVALVVLVVVGSLIIFVFIYYLVKKKENNDNNEENSHLT